jgi:hypothetical protein
MNTSLASSRHNPGLVRSIVPGSSHVDVHHRVASTGREAEWARYRH